MKSNLVKHETNHLLDKDELANFQNGYTVPALDQVCTCLCPACRFLCSVVCLNEYVFVSICQGLGRGKTQSEGALTIRHNEQE